jgi:sugar lactone lactonase YvrE
MAEPLALRPDELGESVGWEANRAELWRVDIHRGLVHRVSGALSSAPVQRTMEFAGEVGFALPRLGGGMVVGAERKIWLEDADGSRRELVEVDEPSANRWNDAICDERGRLWAGTMTRNRRRGSASLYRIDPDGAIENVLSKLTISNGVGWLDGGTRLHLVDSPTHRLDVFEVDVDDGRLTERATLARFPIADGVPDGLCIDVEGGSWIAFFGGATVRRYDRRGHLDDQVLLPAPHVTDVCLGGADGQDLFMTTARHKLSVEERRRLPLAGRVFHCRTSARGEPLLVFAG